MNEWIDGLGRAASRAAPGCTLEEVRRAETEAGYEMPEELRALYMRLNGGDLPGGIHLYCLHACQHEEGVVEKSRKMLVGLPAAGLWRFGRKGEHHHLFVARKSAIAAQAEDISLPPWAEHLEEDAWVSGAWDEARGEARLYRTLAELAGELIPEVLETVRAEGAPIADRAAVESALGVVGRLAAEGLHPVEEAGKGEEAEAAVEHVPGRPVGTASHPERHLPSAEDVGLTPGAPATPMPVAPPPIGLEGLTSHPPLHPAGGKQARARAKGRKAPAAREAPAEAAAPSRRGAAARGRAAAAKPRAAAARKAAPAARGEAKGAAAGRGTAAAGRGAAAKRGAAAGKGAAAGGKGAATKRGAVAKRGTTAAGKGAAAKPGAAARRGTTAKRGAATTRGAAAKRGTTAARKGAVAGRGTAAARGTTTAKRGAAAKRGTTAAGRGTAAARKTKRTRTAARTAGSRR